MEYHHLQLFGYHVLPRLNLVTTQHLGAYNLDLQSFLSMNNYWKKHVQTQIKPRHTDQFIEQWQVDDKWRKYALLYSLRKFNQVEKISCLTKEEHIIYDVPTSLQLIPLIEPFCDLLIKSHSLMHSFELDEAGVIDVTYDKIAVERAVANGHIWLQPDNTMIYLTHFHDNIQMNQVFVDGAANDNLALLVTEAGKIWLIGKNFIIQPVVHELMVLKVQVTYQFRDVIEGLLVGIDGSLWAFDIYYDGYSNDPLNINLLKKFDFDESVVEVKNDYQDFTVNWILTSKGKLYCMWYNEERFIWKDPVLVPHLTSIQRYVVNREDVYFLSYNQLYRCSRLNLKPKRLYATSAIDLNIKDKHIFLESNKNNVNLI